MGKNNKTVDIEANVTKTNELEAKDKKEIKKSSWYAKLQKPIRIIGIIITSLFMLYIPKIKWSDRILDFDMADPKTINIIHGRIFGSYVGEVVTTVSDGVVVALGAALASFILACIWEAFDNDTWYKYQNIGLCICGFIGLYFPIANLIIGGGKLVSSGYVIATYVIVVIITIALAVFNIIKFKNKKDVYASEKKLLKKGPVALILIASIGAFLYPVISLADEYIEVNEIRQLVENHPEEYREDVEEQMGNYAMGKAFAYREQLYVVDEMRKEEGCYGVYRIDREGNCDLVWRIESKGIVNRLVVHDGYMYVSINDGSGDEKMACIIRCGIGSTNQEVVVSFNGMVDFGIYDNQLMYYEFLDRSGNMGDYGTVYTVDLEKNFNDSNRVLYDKRIAFRQFDYETWMNILLYNKQVEYYYRGKYPQSYENATLYINDHRELMKSIYPEETAGGDYGVDYYHAIDWNVYVFNIYDDRIYYVKAVSDDGRENICSDNELWVCDMNGENRRKIGVFPSDSGVENEVIFICDGLYVTEDYVVCDFYRGENGMRERYMMRIDGGFYSKVY